MNYKILVQPEAENDLISAARWYEKKLKGLGESYLLSVDSTIQAIMQNPELFPIIINGIRRALIRKFPFSVFYLIDKERINIIAVFHTSRDPNNWEKRI